MNISEHCLRLGFLANPRNIMMDSEYSTMRAIVSIFGIGVIGKGCIFFSSLPEHLHEVARTWADKRV